MEYNFKIEANKVNDMQIAKLLPKDKCILDVKIELNDLLQFLLTDKKFCDFHNNQMRAICYKLDMDEDKNITLRVEGNAP